MAHSVPITLRAPRSKKKLIKLSDKEGVTWADSEVVDPDLAGGDEDFMPRALVTSDGVLHFAWIRGDSVSGYGDVYHRMRDIF